MTTRVDDLSIFTPTIVRAEAFRLKVPLLKPYENALGSLHHFDAILYRLVTADGREGWGEACAVTGYSPETPEQAWALTCDVLPKMLGDGRALVELTRALLPRYPFVVSAINEALQDSIGFFLGLASSGARRVELLGTVNSLDAAESTEIASALVAKGYRTLKVKVGYEPVADADRVARIAKAAQGQALLRVDANQGYSVFDALVFASRVPSEAIEVFEQPVAQADWPGIEKVCGKSGLPMMLDESIYGVEDIERAAAIHGVTALKLKMSKAGGPKHLIRQVDLCRRLGLKVVIGNGVATDLGCLHEALLYGSLNLETAGEMNGFSKPATGLLSVPLTLDGPYLVIPDNYPDIDHYQLEEFMEGKRSAT